MNLADLFTRTCSRYASRVAVADETSSLTFGRYLMAARRMAALLFLKTRRRHVGVMLPTCKEFVITFFAALLAGKVPVPLNFLLKREELEYIIGDAGLDTVVSARFFRETLDGLVEKPIYLEDLKGRRGVPLPWRFRRREDDTACIIYTSGTTANPKGVMLTHRNFLEDLRGCVEQVHFDHNDIILGVLPLFHSFALTTTAILPFYIGAKTVYLKRFTAPAVLRMIEEHRVTALLAIASLFRVLVRTMTAEKGTYDTSSLRLCVAGGEALPTELSKQFEAAFGMRLLEGYGLTETSPVISVNSLEEYKMGTAGRPLPNVRVQITDDDGHPLPPGKEGEIWTAGPHVMKGYYNLPEMTRETITPDGWLKTGDIGKLDEGGFLSVTGRKKELIISSGENISPNEIEFVITQHPKVFEVAVVPMPDKTRGEVPRAYVALRPGESCTERDIKQFCEGRLAKYKVPKVVEFRDELPHGPTGKVLKRAL
ncbi:MAG: long-chain fatty acid--CoA ligase [Planctomycetes bacterium]|nr:long-chain fatty acid--CoA ligase [Planctomycetota bacterium]